MISQKCYAGIEELERTNVQSVVCKDLQIAFYDRLGLSSDLCKLQNRYAIQGTCNFKSQNGNQNPKMPILYIDSKDMGTLDNLKIQDIMTLAQPSSFGLGDKTVYDENVRKANEIKADRIKLRLDCPGEVQNMAPTGYEIDANLYKLAIYEKDGFFAEHCDTQHAKNHLGTLVICLPVPHEGGAFILTDDGNELRLPFDELIKDGKIPWVSFYTDVKHKVEVVKSGVRMTLQFDLTVQKIDPRNEYKSPLEIKIKKREYTPSPEDKYHFQDFNQEILSCIRDKLAAIFLRKRSQITQENISDLNLLKRERSYDVDSSHTQTQTTKQFKLISGDSELELSNIPPKPDDDDDDDVDDADDDDGYEEGIKTKTKEQFANPDGIAIMLKRRYGMISLSLDKLKGSDSALYHTLKDDFILEVKHIILEQRTNYEGEYKGQPIEIVALSHVSQRQDAYSSDEEVEIGQDNKSVPRKYIDNDDLQGKTVEEENTSIKKVCLVSGCSSKSIKNLVSQNYIKYTGNESQSAVNAYQHAALFIYPKVSL